MFGKKKEAIVYSSERYYDKDSKECASILDSNTITGISPTDAMGRRSKYGYNILREKKKTSPILMFLQQFKSFIIYILLFAVFISLLSHEYVDAVVILIILVFNAIFGFIQEYKAEKAIDALKKLSALKVRALRGGQVTMLDSQDIVPGDIIFLEEGSKIPADGRILECTSLQVAEASLTGESVPVSKNPEKLSGTLTIADRKNMVFSGTIVTKGKAKVLVTSTGMGSELGKIAGMLTEFENEQTPLQKKLESLGHKIGISALVICFFVFVAGIIEDGILKYLVAATIFDFVYAAKEWFLTAVSLAVAAVPEGLPAIVTIALAIGVKKMVRRNALIRRLPSVETLGETTVICSDKTGTLTRNEMTVRKAYVGLKDYDVSGEGYATEGEVKSLGRPLKDKSLFLLGALCNDAVINRSNGSAEVIGDPTEAALLVSASKAGVASDVTLLYPRVSEIEFSSERKMMSTEHRNAKTKRYIFVTKGASERVLDRCTHIYVEGKVRVLNQALRFQVLEKNKEYARQALRVLGFAYKEYGEKQRKSAASEKSLIFAGLQAMIDPARSEVKEAIRKSKEAGIRVIMMTGDNVETAKAIASDIGIEGEAMDGSEFMRLSDSYQSEKIAFVNIFARVEPAHKMRMVELLQRSGEVVAMTGDGVNDAPAIKKADLGIAMGITGTDVAKEASDMVLQDDNFASIVNAIEEGRGIYTNIKKFVNYLLSCNLGEILVIFTAVLLNFPLPMTAVMLLWLNLVTDGLPALALSFDPNPIDLMKRPPKKKSEGIITGKMAFNMLYVSLLITCGVLFMFDWALVGNINPSEHEVNYAQTIALTTIIMMEIARLHAIRSEHKLSFFSNKYLVFAILTSVVLQLVILYTPLNRFFGTVPLGLTEWSMILGVTAVVYVLSMFGVKMIRGAGA